MSMCALNKLHFFKKIQKTDEAIYVRDCNKYLFSPCNGFTFGIMCLNMEYFIHNIQSNNAPVGI